MNSMQTSPAGRKLIEQFEGLELEAYRDVKGVWTIGYGHTSAAGLPMVRPGMEITQAEADAILSSDLASVEADVNHHVIPMLNQNQFDALVSFDYNTGALDRSNVLNAVNHGQDNAVPALLMQWDHTTINGYLVVVSGLAKRRELEGELFMTPMENNNANS